VLRPSSSGAVSPRSRPPGPPRRPHGGTLEITFPTLEWASLSDPWSGAITDDASRNLLNHATQFTPRTVRCLLETW